MATKTKKMKVWMTKYALTSGIRVVWVDEPAEGSKYVYTIPKGNFGGRMQLKLGSTAWVTWQGAFAHAELQREKMIRSLKKKITDLERMKFSGTP